ncbi:MAG TPA: PH domain-containing protein [Acidimicrobiales bacterium]|nr:PH domain-containing protein [Acidimicrobiales bacterium]
MAFPERLLNESEEVLVDTHPHWWIFAGVVARLVLAIALAIGLVVQFDGEALNYLGIGLIALAVLNLLVVYLKWRTTDFVLTTDRLVTRTGILSRNSREIPLERINDLSCHQSLFERVIHAGDLMVESGGERGQSTFSNFGDPFELQNAVHRAIEARND